MSKGQGEKNGGEESPRLFARGSKNQLRGIGKSFVEGKSFKKDRASTSRLSGTGESPRGQPETASWRESGLSKENGEGDNPRLMA